MTEMTDASDLQRQRLCTLVCDYFICQTCGIIDRDPQRLRVGHRCPTCSPEEGWGQMAFQVNIHRLVDLMQEVFHLETSKSFRDHPTLRGRDVNTLLIFRSLREALLTNFLNLNTQPVMRGRDAERPLPG